MLPTDSVLEQLLSHFQQNPRVKGAWLKGSRARGYDADRHSDLDLHLWLDPADHPEFLAELETVLSGLFPLISFKILPGDWMVVTQLLNPEGTLVAVDLFLDQGGAVTLIKGQHLLLWDRDGTMAVTEAVPPSSEALRENLEVAIQYFWRLFAALPSIERNEFISAVARLSHLAEQVLLTCTLGRGRPRELGSNHGNELLLVSERQAIEAALTVGDLSRQSLVEAHFRLARMMQHHGRLAAHALGARYPERQESVVLDHLRQELARLQLTYPAV